MLIISRPRALFKSGTPMICRMPFLEKWQLANEFSVSKVNRDANKLLSAKKSWRFHYSLKNQQCKQSKVFKTLLL